MATIKTITSGFKARKNQLSYEVKVEVFRLGFYISLYDNGFIINTMHRVKLKKAEEVVDECKRKLLKKGYIVTDKPKHNIRFDEKELTYSVKL